MDNSIYATLSRQTGLMAQMDIIANNIANISTNGFRREDVVFAENIAALEDAPSLSMASSDARYLSDNQGPLRSTGGTFDLAIEGDGYFLVATPEGERLTRAGQFTTDAEGQLTNAEGLPVLDAGGASIIIPAGSGPIGVGSDGTISANGNPIGQVGVVRPIDPLGMTREAGTRFRAPDGFVEVEAPQVLQGFLEGSNVNPILEVARMIDVQRSYELGQQFLDAENERIRSAISSLSE